MQFGSPRRRHSDWLPRLLLAIVVGAALVAVIFRPTNRPAKHPAASASPVSITRVGHRILGITAGYELFGLTSDSLVSIQFARGQITRTVLPPALRDAPVSFVVGPHEVIIRPLEDVPGYVLPEGQRSRSLSGSLARDGQLLPGPNPVEEWYIGKDQQVMLGGPVGSVTGLPSAAPTWQFPAPSASPGRAAVVSPDGALAVVATASGAQPALLDLVNLRTGRSTTIPVLVGPSPDAQTIAWSPDSRWLFLLAGDGELIAVRASDARACPLGVSLPAFSQIAMRG